MAITAIPGYDYGSVARAPLNLADLDALKQSVLLGDDDVAALRRTRPVLEPQVDAILMCGTDSSARIRSSSAHSPVRMASPTPTTSPRCANASDVGSSTPRTQTTTKNGSIISSQSDAVTSVRRKTARTT